MVENPLFAPEGYVVVLAPAILNYRLVEADVLQEGMVLRDITGRTDQPKPAMS